MKSMSRPALVLATVLGIGGPAGSHSQQTGPPTCGRVVAVSCTGPSSAVSLLLAPPSARRNITVVIPAEHRALFGSRIEERFEQRQLCVTPPPLGSPNDLLVVRSNDRLVVTGGAEPTARFSDDVYRTCDPDVVLPKVLHTVYAQYTSDALRAKVEGLVVLQGIVGRDGVVGDVRILQPLEASIDEGAQRALAQWTFRPATHSGQPVAMAVTIEMVFTLH